MVSAIQTNRLLRALGCCFALALLGTATTISTYLISLDSQLRTFTCPEGQGLRGGQGVDVAALFVRFGEGVKVTALQMLTELRQQLGQIRPMYACIKIKFKNQILQLQSAMT